MDYELGLRTLKARLPTHTLDEFHVHEARLRENLRRERLYGSTETIRSEQAAILDALNQLAQTHLGMSFNDLCQPAAQSEARPTKPTPREETKVQERAKSRYDIRFQGPIQGVVIGDGAQVTQHFDTPAAKESEDRLSPAEERDILEQELAQHKRNLGKLRLKLAKYTALEAPIHLLNQIEDEEREIGRIEAELERREGEGS